MFKNLRRGRQARNFTTNGPKILDLKSSSEQIFSKNWRWVPLSIAGPAPVAWISLFLYVALMNSLQHFLPYKGWDKNSFTLENDTFHFRQFISHIPIHLGTRTDTGLCLWPSMHVWWFLLDLVATRLWLSHLGFLRIWITRQVSLIVSDERVSFSNVPSICCFREWGTW